MSLLISDERGGLPSASGMTRIYHCPASFRLNKMEMPSSSEAADEGTMLHGVCERGIFRDNSVSYEEYIADIESLNTEQCSVVKFCKFTVEKFYDELIAKDESVLDFKEMRLVSKSGLFSGKADLTFVQLNYALVIDYKFGRGEVEPAEYNMQLATLAVLAMENYNVDTVDVAIIQPRAQDKDKRITKARFGLAQLHECKLAIDLACGEAVEAEHPRQKCGYWCKFCPSSYRCKAAHIEMAATADLVTAPACFAITASNARAMLERARIVGGYCADIIVAVKTFVIENPEADCGLELKAGINKRTLPDAVSVLEWLEKRLGRELTREEMIKLVSFKIGDLEDFLVETFKAAGDTLTKKDLYNQFGRELKEKGLVESVQYAPSLKIKD